MGKHTIMIIKNAKGKYLNYYDERWNSYLFINNKVVNELDDNYQKNLLASDLNVKPSDINLTLVKELTHTKYSESAKKEKEYHHYFYKVMFLKDYSFHQQETFSINEKNYRWFSMDELKTDQRIQKVNSDIISIIEGLENE